MNGRPGKYHDVFMRDQLAATKERRRALTDRAPRCCACGIPTTWELLGAAGWVAVDELGWMCPECQSRSKRLHHDLGELR